MPTAIAPAEEERVIRDWISDLDLPAGVRLKDVHEFVDSTGSMAWRIDFAVSRKLVVNKKFLTGLNEIANQVEKHVLQLGSERWPFVHFLESK